MIFESDEMPCNKLLFRIYDLNPRSRYRMINFKTVGLFTGNKKHISENDEEDERQKEN